MFLQLIVFIEVGWRAWENQRKWRLPQALDSTSGHTTEANEWNYQKFRFCFTTASFTGMEDIQIDIVILLFCNQKVFLLKNVGFQIQQPSITSVLEVLNIINGIVFIQIRWDKWILELNPFSWLSHLCDNNLAQKKSRLFELNWRKAVKPTTLRTQKSPKWRRQEK